MSHNSISSRVSLVNVYPDPLLPRFADFLRLNVAQGDASEATLRAYYAHVRDFVAWCAGEGLNPAAASYADLITYRKYLVEQGFSRGTIAYKVAALRRFYEAARAWGLRPDNPAQGLKPPSERTAHTGARPGSTGCCNVGSHGSC